MCGCLSTLIADVFGEGRRAQVAKDLWFVLPPPERSGSALWKFRFFVSEDGIHEFAVGGDFTGLAEVVPDGAEGHGLHGFKEGEAPGIIARVLGFAEGGGGLEEGDEEGALHISGANDPCGDAVDAGIEEIETDVGAVEEAADNEFACDGEEVVVKGDDMVAIPAHASADMEKEPRDVEHDGRNLVGDGFGGVEVTGVEAEEGLVLDGVAEVEFVGADDIAFGAEPEELALDGIEVMGGIDRWGEDGVEGVFEALARGEAVGGGILKAVGDPDIGHAGGAEFLPEVGSDLAAADAVIDPELPDVGIDMGEGEAVVSLGVGEEGGVEIEADVSAFCPVGPSLEMLGLDGVALDLLSAVIEVDGMEVEAVGSGDEAVGEVEVALQFLDGAGPSGVVTGGHDASAGEAGGGFKPADVIPLPAMHGDGNGFEGLEGGVDINADFGVLFTGEGKAGIVVHVPGDSGVLEGENRDSCILPEGKGREQAKVRPVVGMGRDQGV